jgi:hypothetical protein
LPIEANDLLAITIVFFPSLLLTFILWLSNLKKQSITRDN